MSFINDFLRSISVETRNVIWYIFIVLLVVIACIITGIYCFRKFKSYRVSVVSGGMAFLSFGIVITIALGIEKLTDNVILLSGVTYYIPYLLCASYVLSKYLKRDFSEVADVVALAYLPARAVNIIGCTVAGCCQGMPVKWGLYSAVLKTNVIPVQLYESAAIFAIWAILNRLYKRNRFSQNGKCAILSLILFGGLNTVTDIFTYIQPKVAYMISVEGIFAFLTMCAGLVLLYIVDNQKTQKPSAVAETCNN